MEEGNETIGSFGLLIKMIKLPDGRVVYRLFDGNKFVPKEAVILQLKSYLKNEEDAYHDDFKNNSLAFKREG